MRLRLFTWFGILLLGGLAWLVTAWHTLDAAPAPFDANEWRSRRALALEADPGCLRGAMAAGLMANEALLSKTRSEVEAILGQSDRRTADTLVYALGQCHGMGWLHSELVIAFDAKDQVAGARARQSR
jgi:hypothetical protein